MALFLSAWEKDTPCLSQKLCTLAELRAESERMAAWPVQHTERNHPLLSVFSKWMGFHSGVRQG